MSEENVSLPVAQALASALSKIEAYVPTEYVDNSEPDLDAEHLNHAEQGIMRVTNLLNAAVDVIQGQESRLSDAENKIGTAALTGGMTDLSSGLNKLDSDLGLVSNRIKTTSWTSTFSVTLNKSGDLAMVVSVRNTTAAAWLLFCAGSTTTATPLISTTKITTASDGTTCNFTADAAYIYSAIYLKLSD